MKTLRQITEAKETFPDFVTTYHYSPHKFHDMDISHLSGGTDQKGPGLYSSTEHETHYGQNMHALRIDTRKYIRPGQKVDHGVIKDMVHNSPHLEDVSSNWDEDHHAGVRKLVHACANAPDMHEAMERVWHDAYRSDNHSFLENASLHYHGTIVKPHKFRPSVTHYVSWHPRSVKISHEDHGHDHEDA